MRPNCCLTILRVSICAALLLTLDADSEYPDCEVEVRVNRNTVYEAFLGEDFRIHCTVEFCSGSPPTVSWNKRGTTDVPVNVSSGSHIKTEWELLKHLEGRSVLIFQKVRRNDSGVYQCRAGGSVSHNINVSVHGDGMLIKVSVHGAVVTSEPGEDSDCEVEVRVNHYTVYEAFLGGDLRIHCPVEFCSGSPPTVSWNKRETTDVPVNVSSGSHIKTEWELLKHLEGRSVLIFQKVRRNDSGVYQCKAGGSVSHNINVSVHGAVVTSEPGTEDTFWPFVYRVVGMTVFYITMLTVCVASRRMFKGKCRDTPSRQPSHDALPPSPIDESSQPCLEINPPS